MIVTPAQYNSWNGFDFVQKASRKLVVTVGESWTWGDSLGQANHFTGIDDKEFRLSNNYGGQLAKTLNADFLNVAEPGQSNLWIATQLHTILKNLHEFDYNEILIAVTLTEIGREFESELDAGRNYGELLADISNINDFFKVLSTMISAEIQKSLDLINTITNKKIKIFLGTNFVESNYPGPGIFNKSWVQLIAEKQNMEVSIPCYVANSWVYERYSRITCYAKRVNREKYLKEMENIFETAEKRIDFLDRSRYNVNSGSKHPTIEGHEIWKECILKETQ